MAVSEQKLLFVDHFQIEGDADFVADHAGIGGDSEIVAIDFGGRGNAHSLIAPGIFHRASGSINVEDNLFGDAVNSQVASDLQLTRARSFDLLRDKGDRGILLHVEEVGAAQKYPTIT